MRIAKNTVVTISYEMSDAEGTLLEKSEQSYSYLHGVYHGVFPAVEQALEGMGAGETCDVTLEPEDAFGEYDEELLRVEPRSLFPESVAVGMQFEGVAMESGEHRLYIVTDVAQDKVVVDGKPSPRGQDARVLLHRQGGARRDLRGNHPWARAWCPPGQSFRLPFAVASSYQFACTAHASGQLSVVVEPMPETAWARLRWRVREFARRYGLR